MSHSEMPVRCSTSRREFLKTSSTALAGATLLGAISARSYAAEDNTIKVALVGCGGRGTGAAAQALSTKGPTVLWAMADVFEDRLQPSLQRLSKAAREAGGRARRAAVPRHGRLPQGDRLAGPRQRRPLGHAARLPADAPGIRGRKGDARVHGEVVRGGRPGHPPRAPAGEEATKKNLTIAGGLMSRHAKCTEEVVRQIHDGAIGEVITCWAYREHGPVGFTPKTAGMSELAHQIRNYSNFTWLNGTFQLDWLIHQMDVCCWAKNAWPVSAQGQGGRQVRTEPDQLFDHYAVEYTFPDGTRMFSQGRHIAGCWDYAGSILHGSKGSAHTGEGVYNPRLYKGYRQTAENVIWAVQGTERPTRTRSSTICCSSPSARTSPTTRRSAAKAAMTGILGRMAAESGKLVTWDEALASDLELAPGLDQLTMESPPPVTPDAQGRYPVAMPGTTKVL